MKNDGDADSKVEVSRSQGVQVGSGNIQYLAQPAKAKLDPISLGFLSPEAALARLQQMSHDEIVDLFAHATPPEAADVIKALAAVDEAKVVSTVATHANTSAASIPLAFAQAVEDGRVKPGQLLLMEAMGGGLTWGACVLRF